MVTSALWASSTYTLDPSAAGRTSRIRPKSASPSIWSPNSYSGSAFQSSIGASAITLVSSAHAASAQAVSARNTEFCFRMAISSLCRPVRPP